MSKLRKFGRLFIIKNRFEACAVIYALGLGAIERGLHYMEIYPGFPGWLFMAACTCAVFMAGAGCSNSPARTTSSGAGGQTLWARANLWRKTPTSGERRGACFPAPNVRKWRISAKKSIWHGSC